MSNFQALLKLFKCTLLFLTINIYFSIQEILAIWIILAMASRHLVLYIFVKNIISAKLQTID